MMSCTTYQYPPYLSGAIGIAHLSSGRAANSSVSAGDSSFASPLGCSGSGLSREYGRAAGSASFGERCSIAEKDAARGDTRNAGCRFDVLGEATGILLVCLRNAENEGALIFARETYFLTVPALACAAEVGVGVRKSDTEPLVSELDGE